MGDSVTAGDGKHTSLTRVRCGPCGPFHTVLVVQTRCVMKNRLSFLGEPLCMSGEGRVSYNPPEVGDDLMCLWVLEAGRGGPGQEGHAHALGRAG